MSAKEKAPTLSREEYIEKQGISGEHLLDIDEALEEGSRMTEFKDKAIANLEAEAGAQQGYIIKMEKALLENPNAEGFTMINETQDFEPANGNSYSWTRSQLIETLRLTKERLDNAKKSIGEKSIQAYKEFDKIKH